MMIELNQISYQHDDFKTYFDFNIAAKERVIVVGPSGAGKSTLLNLIAGFVYPQCGNIILNQQNVTHLPPSKRPTSMLFQHNNLFSHLTIEQNIALGIKPSLKLSANEQSLIGHILEQIGLKGFAGRFPEQLSGGQSQRVALARCLIQHRPILLLDEPFSALDQALRFEMLALIDQICNQYGLTLMMVSHYLDESLSYFSRCLVVDNGQIIFNDHPEKLKLSENQHIAKILGLKIG